MTQRFYLQKSRLLAPFLVLLGAINGVFFVYFARRLDSIPLFITSSFVVLAVIAELQSVMLDSGGYFTSTSIISLACLWTAGPVAAILVEVAAIGVTALINRTSFIKPLFNVLQAGISIQLAGFAFMTSGGVPGFGDSWPIVPATISTAFYFGVNSLLVNIVISLVEEKPLLSNWFEDLARTSIYAAVNGVIAFSLATILIDRGRWALVVYLIVTMALFHVFKLQKRSERYQLLAEIDELTGLYNYRRFKVEMEGLLQGKAHGCQVLSLVMIDLDDFKLINDTFGHEVGNLVLQAAADLIKKNTRGNELLFRFGGEEFAVLLPETTKDNALAIAERIRRSFELELPGKEQLLPDGLKVTASFGVATFPDDTKSIDNLLSLADHALYQAKSKGKNVVYSKRKGAATPPPNAFGV